MNYFNNTDLQNAISDYKSGKLTEVKNFLHDLIFDETYTKANYESEELHDLVIEFYIFISDGDTRLIGRDFGYSKIQEIEDSLNAMMKKSCLSDAK